MESDVKRTGPRTRFGGDCLIMKNILEGLLGLLWRGFFLALPVLLVVVVLGKLLTLVMNLDTPVADCLLAGTSAGEGTRKLLAAGLLIVFLLLLGLAARTRTGRGAGVWVEENFLESIPRYKSLRNLAQGLAGEQDVSSFRPARVQIREGFWAVGLIVAEHTNGDYTIFFPTAPHAISGRIEIVSRGRTQLLDITTAQAIRWFMELGHGTEALLKPIPPDKSGAKGLQA